MEYFNSLVDIVFLPINVHEINWYSEQMKWDVPKIQSPLSKFKDLNVEQLKLIIGLLLPINFGARLAQNTEVAPVHHRIRRHFSE